MPIPAAELYPPFNITRVSHAVFTVNDLAASRKFYSEVFGLLVSDETADTVYLRGIDEICHHSLVLKQALDTPVCERVGLRVLADPELDKAFDHFRSIGLIPRFVEVPYQGRTLQVEDPFGVPLEFCSRMTAMPRMFYRADLHRGGAAQRFDHVQLHVPDVEKVLAFYSTLGFRCGDYMTTGDDETVYCAFTYRKDNPADLVFMAGPGPRFHHFGYITRSLQDIFRGCDMAALTGYGEHVERGPGLHAVAHAEYVYMRDPSGNRGEMLLDVWHQMLDEESEPVKWNLFGKHTAAVWGLPAQSAWFYEATRFAGLEPKAVTHPHQMLTLQRYLEARDGARR